MEKDGSNCDHFEDIELPPNVSPKWSRLYGFAVVVVRVSVLEERKKKKDDHEVSFERDEQQQLDASEIKLLNTAKKNMEETKKRHASDDNINSKKECQDKPKKKKVKIERINIIEQQQKNTEIDSIFSLMPPILTPEHMNALQTLADGKSIEELNLVLWKNIFQTDISKKHNRLSLPKHIYKCSFLREEEVQYLKSVKENNQNSMNSIEVDVIEPSLETCKLDLREWAVSKGMYVLTKGWNKLVTRNSIEVNQILEIWTARVDQKLCFILVRIPTSIS